MNLALSILTCVFEFLDAGFVIDQRYRIFVCRLPMGVLCFLDFGNVELYFTHICLQNGNIAAHSFKPFNHQTGKFFERHLCLFHERQYTILVCEAMCAMSSQKLSGMSLPITVGWMRGRYVVEGREGSISSASFTNTQNVRQSFA